jgi:aminopeptidase
MRDPRVHEYARLLVERCVGVQPGWEVLVRATPLARPLVEAVTEEIARRGAYPFIQLAWETFSGPFAREAPLEVLREASPLQMQVWEMSDALITISAPESTREGSDLSEERRHALAERSNPIRARMTAMDVPWVICEYPAEATAEEAGMSLREYEEFIYGAVLLDWDAEAAKMSRIADVFDAADEVRIVGEGTDLTLSLAGRNGAIEDGHINMPGGEVFYSPVEEFLLDTLATDDGARRLGELGIGCNPGIQQFMKNIAFDEKIDGTIHLAVGNSYSFIGGKNVSAVHWDIVKDLRPGGRLYADGELVQADGVWQL